MSDLPEKVAVGAAQTLEVDVAQPRPGDIVTFTVATKAGEGVQSLSAAVNGKSAKASWVPDAGPRTLPLAVTIKATLRGEEHLLGETTLVAGTRVSTLGWLDSELRRVPVDPDAKMHVVPAGSTVFLKFDVDDGTGAALKETLALEFVLERKQGEGAFTPIGTFADESKDVKKFERKFDVPNDDRVPATLRIAVSVRRKGETDAQPSLGRHLSPPLQVVIAAPVIASFLGRIPDPKKERFGEVVPLVEGQKITLRWEIQGAFDEVRIEPGSIDVKGATKVGADGVGRGTKEIDPATNPPDKDGEYAILAANKAFQSNIRRVTASSITSFAVSLGLGRQTGGRKKILLTQRDGKTSVDKIEGVANKDFSQLGENDFFGQITPGGDIRVTWNVFGLGESRLHLTGASYWTDLDVTRITRDGGGEAFLETHDDSPGAVLDLALVLTARSDDPKKKGPVVSRRIIRVRENYPLPTFDSLQILFDGKPVADGTKVTDWNKVKFRWKLGGDSRNNRLKATIRAEGETREETWKDVKDPRQFIETKPRAGPFLGEVTVDVSLVNLNGTVQKTRKVRLTVEKPPEPTPKPTPVKPVRLPPNERPKLKVGFNYPWAMEAYGTNFDHEFQTNVWRSTLRGHLQKVFDAGGTIFRWFIMANGVDYGKIEAVNDTIMVEPGEPIEIPKDFHCTTPPLDPFMKDRWLDALEIFEKFNADKPEFDKVKLLPTWADFPMFNFRKGFSEGSGGRMDLARDKDKCKKFLDQAFIPFLDVRDGLKRQIFAWEACNEPSWCTRRFSPPLHRWGAEPDLTIEQMTFFLNECLKRIEGHGYQSTVGHRFVHDLKELPTGQLRQFHYYAQDIASNLSEALGDPISIPPFSETKAFVGEVAAGPNFGHAWPSLDGEDENESRTCSARLVELAKKGYELALLWPSRSCNPKSDNPRNQNEQLEKEPDRFKFLPENLDDVRQFTLEKFRRDEVP
ncbi:MAG: hypothetical protein ACAI25_05405 [Planctomycetota bacterium]